MSDQIPAAVKSAFERSEHPFHMWDGIQAIPTGLADVLSEPIRERIREAARALKGKSAIYFIGCGTSYFAGIAATYMFHQVPGYLAAAADAYEFHAYPPARLDTAALVAISHTGTTKSAVRGAEVARQHKAVTIALTDVAGSAIENCVDISIASTMGVERSLPKTRSYLASVLRLYLLADELARLEGVDVTEYEKILEDSPRIASQVLEKFEEEIKGQARVFKNNLRRIVVIGAGPEVATAMEGSLKLTEAALMNSIALEAEEAAHGAWFSISPEDLIILLAPAGTSFEKMQKITTAMKTIGARTWVITDEGQDITDADYITFLPAVPELLHPLFSVIPLYQFTYFLALERGLRPDNMNLSDPRFLQARTLIRESV